MRLQVIPTIAAAAGHEVETEYTVDMGTLDERTTYYVRGYAKVGDDYYYADQVSVKTYWLIYDLDDWNEFAAEVNNSTDATAKAVQMDNISGVTTVIGTSTRPFKGTYNGQGYTISNINISGTTNMGLFGYVNNASSVIENIVVASGSITGSDVNVGAIVGQLSGGTVRYCANYTNVKSTKSNPTSGRARVGGIVGMQASGGGNNNHVLYCINYGKIEGKGYVGGIVGGYGSGYISYSQNYGLVQADSQMAGGVAGWQSFKEDKLTNCHNGGDIKVSAASTQTTRSRYLICNNTLNNPSDTGTLNYPTSTYLYSLTVTEVSTTHTESGLPKFETGATYVTSNPAGITICGKTYSWNTPAP